MIPALIDEFLARGCKSFKSTFISSRDVSKGATGTTSVWLFWCFQLFYYLLLLFCKQRTLIKVYFWFSIFWLMSTYLCINILTQAIRRLKATGTFHEFFGWNEVLLFWFTPYLYSRKCEKNAKQNRLMYFEFWKHFSLFTFWKNL